MNSRTLLCILLAVGAGTAAVAQDEPVDTASEAPRARSKSAKSLPSTRSPSSPCPASTTSTWTRLVGDWDLTIRIWTSPDGEPVESAGTAEARWILDGRFLWTIYRAELFGQPFEAWSIEGYDNQAEQYVGTWRDTQGTYTLVYRGKCRQPPPPDGRDRGRAGARRDRIER